MTRKSVGQQPVVVMKRGNSRGAKGHSLYVNVGHQSVKEAVGETD